MARALPPRPKTTAVEEIEDDELEYEDADDDEPDDDEEEEPTEEELLAEFDDDIVAAARRKTAAVEDGYALSEIANFLKWKPELLAAISAGVFDGVDIKEIVAACFARRTKVMGDRANAAPAAAATPQRAILGEDGGMLRPAPGAPRRFQYEGKFYSKDDMEGRIVRTSEDGGRWYQRGLLAKIVSVGNAYLVVNWIDNPREKYPSSTELMKKNIGAGGEGKISADSVAHIFG